MDNVLIVFLVIAFLYYYSIFQLLAMNFTILGRKSTAGQSYTDRPSLQYTSLAEPWKKTPNEPHQFNPSKSKLNVKSSLTKTSENMTRSNHNLDSIRMNAFIANPITNYRHIKKESLIDEKILKNSKEVSDNSIQASSKNSFYKCSTAFVFTEEHSKKNQPSFLRRSVNDDCLYKTAGEKDKKCLEQIKDQIITLSKRVFISQDQICKLKEKKQKDKKLQTLEQEFTQFQIQMFDILKKNSSFFFQFQAKIQKNANLLQELRQKKFTHTKNDELLNKLNACEAKISELTDIVRIKEENSNKTVANLISNQQNQIKSLLSDQLSDIKLRLDKSAVLTNEILLKMSKIDEELKESSSKVFQIKIDSRKCYSPIIIEKRQVLVVKQNDKIRDTTKQHLNYDMTHSDSYNVANLLKENRQGLENRREIVLQQTIYYVDSQGYLLDQSKCYLLNSKNQQILIPEKMLLRLRQNNILVSPNLLPNSMLMRR